LSATATKAAEDEQLKAHTSQEHLTAISVASGSSSKDTLATAFASRRQTCHAIFSAYLEIMKQASNDGGPQGCNLNSSHSSASSSNSVCTSELNRWPMQSDAWTSGAVNAAAEMAALCSVVEELEQQLSD